MQSNKLEKLISVLIVKTKNDEIHWKNIGKFFPTNIRHSELINRSFRCEDYKTELTLYFTQFVFPEFILSGGEEFDKEFLKLYIFERDKLIKEVNHDEVDDALLLNLYDAIDEHNTDLKDFLDDV